MLRGNRLLFSALGLVAVATIAIGWLTFPSQPVTQQFRYDSPRNENYRPGGSECEPSALAKIVDAQVRLRQSDNCKNQAEEYRQASDDLIQQTRAANAAQAQANIASQQLWSTWLQTLGGFLTLAAAVGAAIYARDAATHTKTANELTRNAHRAWITLRLQPKLIMQAPKNGLRIEVDFLLENIGQTVATHFDYECEFLFVAQGESTASLADRVQKQIDKWAAGTTMIADSNLIPTAVELDAVRREIKGHKVKWWSFAPQGVRVSQPVFLGAVLYRTITDPKTLQVSWRTWYLSEKTMNDQPTTFIRENTPQLGVADIFVEPFQTTLMHREFQIPDA